MPQEASGVAHHDRVRGHVMQHDGTHTDQRPGVDSTAAKHRAIRAEIAEIIDLDVP
jgi:hypothetical protein